VRRSVGAHSAKSVDRIGLERGARCIDDADLIAETAAWAASSSCSVATPRRRSRRQIAA
jgi:hypothetical protein